MAQGQPRSVPRLVPVVQDTPKSNRLGADPALPTTPTLKVGTSRPPPALRPNKESSWLSRMRFHLGSSRRLSLSLWHMSFRARGKSVNFKPLTLRPSLAFQLTRDEHPSNSFFHLAPCSNTIRSHPVGIDFWLPTGSTGTDTVKNCSFGATFSAARSPKTSKRSCCSRFLWGTVFSDLVSTGKTECFNFFTPRFISSQ